MKRGYELEKTSNSPQSETLMERLAYFFKTMGWLAVFLIGFLVLAVLIMPLLTEDTEWREYCQEYHPELPISGCKAVAGV